MREESGFTIQFPLTSRKVQTVSAQFTAGSGREPIGLQGASAFSVIMDEKAAKNGFELVQDDRFNLAAALGKFSF